MNARIFMNGLGLALVLLSCGADRAVKDIRQLRIAGQLEQSRDRALAALEDNPAYMEIWLEFARTVVEQSRQSEREGDGRAVDYLLEASLVCGGYYRFKNQAPSREWRDAGRQTAAEATKQANKVLTSLNAQIATVNYLNQLLSMHRGDAGLSGARISAERMVQDYRANARTLLFQSVLMIRLLEMLPDITSGSSALMINQIQSARDEWRQALELPPDLVDTITQRANRAVDEATERVMGDLQTLGYFLPGTIIENGILQ